MLLYIMCKYRMCCEMGILCLFGLQRYNFLLKGQPSLNKKSIQPERKAHYLSLFNTKRRPFGCILTLNPIYYLLLTCLRVSMSWHIPKCPVLLGELAVLLGYCRVLSRYFLIQKHDGSVVILNSQKTLFLQVILEDSVVDGIGWMP